MRKIFPRKINEAIVISLARLELRTTCANYSNFKIRKIYSKKDYAFIALLQTFAIDNAYRVVRCHKLRYEETTDCIFQVSNWFINARVRLWKPMVEEMYNEEIKNQDDQDPKPNQIHSVDEKPIHGYSTTNVSTRAHNAAGQGKVSLTLGLQQNGESTSFAMPQSPHRESLLLLRNDKSYFDEGQDGHFSILGEVDGLPYRNLIDADQLLHDLA